MFRLRSLHLFLMMWFGLHSIALIGSLSSRSVAQDTSQSSNLSVTSKPSTEAEASKDSSPPPKGDDSSTKNPPPPEPTDPPMPSLLDLEMLILWTNTVLIVLFGSAMIGLLIWRTRTNPPNSAQNETHNNVHPDPAESATTGISPISEIDRAGASPSASLFSPDNDAHTDLESVTTEPSQIDRRGTSSSSVNSSPPDQNWREIEQKTNDVIERLIRLEQSLSEGLADIRQRIQEPSSQPQQDNSNFTPLQDLIRQFETSLEVLKTDLLAEISQLRSDTRDPRPTPSPQPALSRLPGPAPSPPPLPPLQLIDDYNNQVLSLRRIAIIVSESEDSQSRRRLGSGDPTEWIKNDRGNYWILQEGGKEYLTPKKGLAINEYNFHTAEVIFECRHYRANYSSFNLIRPAQVRAIASGEKWVVEQSGILEFT